MAQSKLYFMVCSCGWKGKPTDSESRARAHGKPHSTTAKRLRRGGRGPHVRGEATMTLWVAEEAQ